MFEEEDHPDAAFDETVNSDFNTPHSPLSYTLKLPDESTIAQGTGEHSESQQPLAFGNSSNIDGKRSTCLAYSSSCTDILGGSASIGYNLFLRAIATHGSTSLFSLNLLKKRYNRR